MGITASKIFSSALITTQMEEHVLFAHYKLGILLVAARSLQMGEWLGLIASTEGAVGSILAAVGTITRSLIPILLLLGQIDSSM